MVSGTVGLPNDEGDTDGDHNHAEQGRSARTFPEEEVGLMSCRRRHKVEQAGHSRDGAGESGSTALAFE